MKKHLMNISKALIVSKDMTVSTALSVSKNINMDKALTILTLNDDMLPAGDVLITTGKSIRFGMIATAITICVFIIGGALAPLESASVAHGIVVPSGYKKTVQHLEGGIIEKIMVKDGDHVTEGQPLIQLNTVNASSSRGITEAQLFTARVTQARLEALQNGSDGIVLNAQAQAMLTANPSLNDILKSQQELFATDRDAERDKLAIFNQQRAQLHQDIEGLTAQLESAQAQFGYVNESLTTEEDLVDRGLSTRPRLLALKGQSAELQGKVGEYKASVGKAHETELEIAAKISNQKNEYESKNADELKTVREAIAEMEKRFIVTNDVLNRTVIAAPIAGIVSELKYRSAGGVISPGSTIMDIVPEDGSLLIDAQVQPGDISRVRDGQMAKVMFSAYKSRLTPMIEGKVVQVSADRITPPNGTASTLPGGYFLARVEVKKSDVDKLANNVTLFPGMPVEVMVVDGAHSLLGYYLKPLADSFRRAFREQ